MAVEAQISSDPAAGAPLASQTELQDHRANNFDFLRFLLATAVLFDHCFPLLYGPSRVDPISALSRNQLAPSGVAVDFFFVISGFLVTNSWLHCRGVGDYIKRRMLRIYPGFIGASLFCALIVGPLAADHAMAYFSHVNPLKFLGYMLILGAPYMPRVFLHAPFPLAVDGAFWTIRYEFWCYLLVAVMGMIGLYRRRLLPLLLFVCVGILYGIDCFHPLAAFPDRDFRLIGNPQSWLRLLSFYLAGVVFYLWRERIVHHRVLLLLSFLILAGSLFLPLGATAAFLPVLGAYLLLYVAFSKSLRLSHFGRRADLSYGIYLYAFPIQQLLVLYLGSRLTWYWLFVAGLALTCGAAALSWTFIEKPFLRLKKTGSAIVPRTAASED